MITDKRLSKLPYGLTVLGTGMTAPLGSYNRGYSVRFRNYSLKQDSYTCQTRIMVD